MDILWPGFLLLLTLIPALIALYVWMLRRRRTAVRYSSLSLVREAIPRYSRLRRHLPTALFLVALAALIVGLGRPVAVIAVPTDQTVIILALDVSRSMCARDIAPNRLEAAQAAASDFVRNQKNGTQIGIVAFSGFAEVIQAPTADKDVLLTAIASVITGRRTAVGSAIMKSLEIIAEVDENVAPPVLNPSIETAPPPVPKGMFAPDIIVLLTDGASNTGPTPQEAAQQAADRGIRVYTIGFGTAQQDVEFSRCPSQLVGSEPFGGGGFGGRGGGFGGPGGGRFPRGIDEVALKDVATMTDAKYYSAESADDLQRVFESLPINLIVKHEMQELSVFFAAFGTLVALIAVALSFQWHPLLP